MSVSCSCESLPPANMSRKHVRIKFRIRWAVRDAGVGSELCSKGSRLGSWVQVYAESEFKQILNRVLACVWNEFRLKSEIRGDSSPNWKLGARRARAEMQPRTQCQRAFFPGTAKCWDCKCKPITANIVRTRSQTRLEFSLRHFDQNGLLGTSPIRYCFI